MTQEPETVPRGGALAFVIGALLLILFSLSASLVPIRSDNDCWWHIKTGQYILEHGIPTHDVFSFTAAQHEWHNHEWLAQVAYALSYRAGEATGFGGWRGAILFNGLIITATVLGLYVLAARLSRSWWIGLLVGVMVIAVTRRMFYVRPPVVTNFLLMVELWLLVAAKEGWIRRGWLWLLAPMIALWTNLHGGWMAGGILLAAWSGEQLWAAWRAKLPELPIDVPKVILPFGFLAALLPVCLVATLLNPYGYGLYLLPGRVLSDFYLVRAIGELRSPDFYFVIDFELVMHGALVLTLLVRRFRASAFELAIYLFFLHQAVQHVRHLSLFGIVMVPLYARLLGEVVEGAERTLARWRPSWPAGIVVLAPAVLGFALGAWVLVNPRESVNPETKEVSVAGTYPGRNLRYFAGVDYEREAFPTRVADLIQLAELKGPMFNENYYAGYLIWRFAPEQFRVFSDSRFDIFGGSIMRDEEAVSAGADFGDDGWKQILDRYKVGWLITRAETGLGRRLAADQKEWAMGASWPEPATGPTPRGWQIWIRTSPECAEMLARARASASLAGGVAP